MNARIQHKHDKQRIEKLEKRVEYLLGCNDELELMISKYEEQERFNQNLDKQAKEAWDEVF
ncbi:MAG: hypothetical protein CMK23_10220 [Porticoccaceae bacterium]|jgi:hypothetical protein|nr:hypothetical protein [Porticoccaceae bacterium]|tara:strand:+ start:730 stop:912 length:183 start_codon:yes stop_codon:yes gene_type:complete